MEVLTDQHYQVDQPNWEDWPTPTATTTRTTRLPGPPGAQGAPGASLAGAALLAQMVAAMQAAAVVLPAPGPGAPVLLPRVKIPPPIFKGLPRERLQAHLMRDNDWMDTYTSFQ